jgi:anti-sigma-K factor RskA
MIDERHEELAALAALDLLDPADQAALDTAVAANPELGRLVRELREAAAALAHAAPSVEPPPDLRERVLAEARAERTARRSSTLTFPFMIPWAVAACLAAAAALMGRLYVASRSEAAFLRDSQTLASLELRAARAQLEAERIVNQRELTDTRHELADAGGRIADLGRQVSSLDQKLKSSDSLSQYKVTTLASMLGGSSRAIAVAVWCPSMQEGILAISNLPPVPSGKDYQLWVVPPGSPSPVSGGIFTVDSSRGTTRVIFRTAQPIDSIAKFAVSMERKGGSDRAEGPMVLVSD